MTQADNEMRNWLKDFSSAMPPQQSPINPQLLNSNPQTEFGRQLGELTANLLGENFLNNQDKYDTTALKADLPVYRDKNGNVVSQNTIEQGLGKNLLPKAVQPSYSFNADLPTLPTDLPQTSGTIISKDELANTTYRPEYLLKLIY